MTDYLTLVEVLAIAFIISRYEAGTFDFEHLTLWLRGDTISDGFFFSILPGLVPGIHGATSKPPHGCQNSCAPPV